jgi:hypothetical protein
MLKIRFVRQIVTASQRAATLSSTPSISPFPAKKLIGTWKNELGSTMIIDEVGLTGSITGKYKSLVGEAENHYKLTGRVERGRLEGKGYGRPLGFTVVWKNKHKDAHSATSWSGQFFGSESGKDVILTTWLLTDSTKSEDVWESTLIGQDRFEKEHE